MNCKANGIIIHDKSMNHDHRALPAQMQDKTAMERTLIFSSGVDPGGWLSKQKCL